MMTFSDFTYPNIVVNGDDSLALAIQQLNAWLRFSPDVRILRVEALKTKNADPKRTDGERIHGLRVWHEKTDKAKVLLSQAAGGYFGEEEFAHAI